MEITEELRCLFSTTLEEENGSYVIEVPERELLLGEIEQGGTYRVAVLSSPSDGEGADSGRGRAPERVDGAPTPPVEEGETRDVEIEDIGEQGDGITRVERGFVVIVPDTELGERVSVEITEVKENVAFAEVTERLSYYE